MRIAFTMTFAERLGGAENILWTVLQNLDRSRFEPVVIFMADGPFEREVAALGIKTFVVHPGRFRNVRHGLRTIGTLRRIFRDERPALVVNFILKAQIYGAPAAILAGLGDRIVWWQHDLPGRQRLDRLATLLPARAIGTDSKTSADQQSRFRPRRTSFAVLPGIEQPETASPDRVAALRKELGIPESRLIVGILGRLQPWKGQHRFLRALCQLRQTGYDVHGLIVGGDQHSIAPDYEPYVKGLATELQLDPYVTFTGQVSSPGPYLQLMDVCVNASTPEPFGLVVLESMAMGVPTVAVGEAGPSEIIESGRSGVLAGSGEPEDLAGAIEQLVRDSELRRRVATGGVDRYRSNFTVDRMMRDMHRYLDDLTTGTANGSR